jgi:IMP dehydrogenase
MNDVELGRGKRARVAYSLDDVAIAPSRRTRDPEDCSVAWRLDAYSFDLPVVAAPTDSVVSPTTARAIGELGGLPVLNLEGLWTRYEDPQPILDEIAALPLPGAVARLQELYRRPIDVDLMRARVAELRALGIPVAGALSPQQAEEYADIVTTSGVDIFVIRGTTVSAEHVSTSAAPLNLKRFIYDLDVPVVVGGVATRSAALHLMRAGAAGVLVGFGGGATHTTYDVLGVRVPMASAIAEIAAARTDYLDESGGRYVHVIADGGMGRTGDIVKAIACGADAVMVGSMLARASEAPGGGRHWGMEAVHATLPRGEVVELGTVGDLRSILLGPSTVSTGLMNIGGALRRAIATCGYADLKGFQRVDVVVRG